MRDLRIPIFPLPEVVSFPETVLPLHVFEPRYRGLVRRLLDEPDERAREFGVVAIRDGHEVGADGVKALHPVGCAARRR